MLFDAYELWCGLKNAVVVAKEKTWNGGEVQLKLSCDGLVVNASDDFISVSTVVLPKNPKTYKDMEKAVRLYAPIKQIKEFERTLRLCRGQDFNFDLDLFTDEPAAGEWWEDFERLQEKDFPLRSTGVWECNPERLSIFSRLEPKGEYPISWKYCMYDAVDFWAFRYGPATCGIITLLDRTSIQEEHGAWLW